MYIYYLKKNNVKYIKDVVELVEYKCIIMILIFYVKMYGYDKCFIIRKCL